MFGAVTGRAEAITLRLSAIFALLDCSKEIRLAHLAAALELWRYAEESARFIFGSALGDVIADTIWSGIQRKPKGLTRTEISQLFARKKSAEHQDAGGGGLINRGTETPWALESFHYC